MTTATIAHERAGLESQRSELIARRVEVAKLLRQEHIDVQARRELREEQELLTGKIRGLDIELETLADVQVSEVADRRAALIAEGARARDQALKSAKRALSAFPDLAAGIQEAAALLADRVAHFRAAEASIRQALRPVVDVQVLSDLCLDSTIAGGSAMLSEIELKNLIEHIPRGQLQADRSIIGPVNYRAGKAIEVLSREER